LHLDQFQIDLPRIFQAVLYPDRNVSRFIFVNTLGLVADDDPGSASHHDPVFGAVMVHLQREPSTRLHNNA
jgi:hypothetical protein